MYSITFVHVARNIFLFRDAEVALRKWRRTYVLLIRNDLVKDCLRFSAGLSYKINDLRVLVKDACFYE